MAFTLFQELALEIRLMIWERVPQPARLIGQVPCSNCTKRFKTIEERKRQRQTCIVTNHPDYRLRFILQPSKDTPAIFPPLHACRESRSVWLPRYFQPPRYINLNEHGFEPDATAQHEDREEHQSSYALRFDVPFISYETDTFAMFDAWHQSQIDVNDAPIIPDDQFLDFFDPFRGFEREKIQHVAMGESAQHLAMGVVSLDIKSLPRLQRLSVLSYGLDPSSLYSKYQLEMRSSNFQLHECKIFKIPLFDTDDFLYHPRIFMDRPRHYSFEPRPEVRRLGSYMSILKALLWHSANTNLEAIRLESFRTIFDFEDYALNADLSVGGRLRCPLEHVEGCGITGHYFQEIVDWKPSFEIDNLLICEDSSVEKFFGDKLSQASSTQWS